MSATEWSALGGVLYELREIYSLSWGVDIDASRLACAPFGGPVAVVRDDRKILRNAAGLRSGAVQIFSAAGAALGKFVWDRPARLVAFSWTDDEALLCIADDGGIYPYTADGELLPWQASLGAECAAQGVAAARVWPTGLVALTRTGQLFVVTDLSEALRVTTLDVPPLEATPHALAAIPPEHTGDSVHVLLAVDTTVCCVAARLFERHTHFGRVTHLEVTNNGALVALLNDAGRLYVTSPDLRTLLCELDTTPHGDPAAVLSCAWCGADAVVLHWPDALLLVGPVGDALRFPLDASAAVATECDSLRVLTSDHHLLLRRVPEPLARCLGVGSTAPGALLADALDAFDKGSARAEEALRAVGPALTDAAADCAAAALHAWDPAQQRALLRASAFGTAHVPLAERAGSIAAAAVGAPGAYAQACRTLRVLNAVRHHLLGGIPLTAAQYAALPGGPGPLITRLLAARRHLLALRLCDSLGAPPARVLLHWASAKICTAVALSDRQLLDVLMDKLRGVPGIPFGDVASEAFRRGRPRLAALLLDYEQRSGEQVPLLTSMGEDDRALAKAVESGDSDLVYLALFSLYRKQPSFSAFAEVVARKPEARALFVAYCRRTDAELLKSFLYAVGDAAATADAVLREALCGLALAPPSPGALDPGVVAKLLEQSGELYGKCKHDFASWAVSDAARLLKAQLELEYADATRARTARSLSGGGASRFAFIGHSLADTVLTALIDGHPKAAAKLRADFKLSDKHWTWLRARAAVARSDWDALYSLAEDKKPPVGHVALVELALDARAPRVELSRLIARVGDASARAGLYGAAGLALQAQQAAAEAAEQQGSSYAKQAQNLLAQTLGRLTLGGAGGAGSSH